jgi:hypothetical protein
MVNEFGHISLCSGPYPTVYEFVRYRTCCVATYPCMCRVSECVEVKIQWAVPPVLVWFYVTVLWYTDNFTFTISLPRQ